MTSTPPFRFRPLPGEHPDSAIRRLVLLQGYPDSHTFGLGGLSQYERFVRSCDVLGIGYCELDAYTLRPYVNRSRWAVTHDLFKAQPVRCECDMTSFWSEHLLVTSCPFCGRSFAEEVPQPDRDTAADFQHALIGHYEASTPVPTRLERLVPLLELDIPGRDDKRYLFDSERQARRSRHAVVRFLAWAWPATRTTASLELAITQRVRAALGLPPAPRTLTDQIAAAALLDARLETCGLQTRHLPDWLPAQGADAIGTVSATHTHVRRAAAAALIAWMEVSHQRGTRRSHLHTEPEPDATSRWVAWFLTRPAGLQALSDLVAEFVREPPIDRGYARATLRTLRHLPTDVAKHLSFELNDQHLKAAASWIWLDQTNDSLRSRPGGMKGGRALLDFAARLAPDDRLLLREFGDQYLHLNADLMTAATAPTEHLAQTMAAAS